MAGIITSCLVLALVVFVGLYVVSTYNRLVSEQLKVDNQWSQIDIVLKQRADTIPSLVEIVKGYASHEKQLLEEVSQARTGFMEADTPERSVQAAGMLSSSLGRLFAVAENYPELKANENFMELQRRYDAMENKIADFRQFYNDTVMRYNQQVLTFPASLIARMFHFEQRAFFQVDEKDKQAPVVKF